MSAGRAHFQVEDLLALAGVLHKRTTLAPPDTPADKVAALRRHHALNPRPQSVRDPAFVGADPLLRRQRFGPGQIRDAAAGPRGGAASEHRHHLPRLLPPPPPPGPPAPPS